jgi:phosphoribosyl-ATP pyrophosphohydrolase
MTTENLTNSEAPILTEQTIPKDELVLQLNKVTPAQLQGLIALGLISEENLTETKIAPSPSVLVREFHETYGQTIRTTPVLNIPEKLMRLGLVEEETEEYGVAVETDDLVEIADALADIVYVAFGAALAHGIDLDEVLQEVQRSNLSKLGADGEVLRRADGKIIKGPNFSEPDIATVLRKQGWTE